VTHKHYDVVVLGRSLGALATAALLARRTFTVLVVGQGARPASYRLGERVLLRRAFTLLAGSSPAFLRLIVELAQSQTWKRRAVSVSPMLQALSPGRRFEIAPDMGLFAREIEREFPELRRVVDELYTDLAQVNGAADEAFARDAVWPPGTFWERRETARYAAMLPHAHAEPDADLLAEFPRGHPFRQIVDASVLFATDVSSRPPPVAVARLHGAWTRGLTVLPGGEEELEDFFVERIQAYGGVCRLGERASGLLLRRGVASGVTLDGDAQPTSAGFVVTDAEGERVAALSAGQGIHKRARREWPRITSGTGRFVVSIVAHTPGIPAPLGTEMFVLPGLHAPGSSGLRADGSRPVVHLQRGLAQPSAASETLLVAELLLSDRGPLALADARQAVLEIVCAELPYLEPHLIVVDSVHDGLPVWVYEGGRRRNVDRIELRDATTAAEPMVRQLEVDPPGYLGLAGEPIRGPVERTLLVGRSVLPALGQEGQLLAAWGAARLITRTDRQKERMRREMWNKVEIG
jgi:phytoene dehydrogenase-like protein